MKNDHSYVAIQRGTHIGHIHSFIHSVNQTIKNNVHQWKRSFIRCYSARHTYGRMHTGLKWTRLRMACRPRAICGQRYPLPCFAWFWIRMRGSRETLVCLSVCPFIHTSVHPPRPSQAWYVPSHACNLPTQDMNMRGQIWYLRGQVSGLRGQISGLWGPGGMKEQTNKKKNERTNESPLVFYRTLFPSEPLPKKIFGLCYAVSCHLFVISKQLEQEEVCGIW